MYELFECLRVIAVLLEPFLPETAPKILESLGDPPNSWHPGRAPRMGAASQPARRRASSTRSSPASIPTQTRASETLRQSRPRGCPRPAQARHPSCWSAHAKPGVAGVIAVGAGYGIGANAGAVMLAEEQPGIWATTGVHPHDASEWSEIAGVAIEGWSAHKPCGGRGRVRSGLLVRALAARRAGRVSARPDPHRARGRAAAGHPRESEPRHPRRLSRTSCASSTRRMPTARPA